MTHRLLQLFVLAAAAVPAVAGAAVISVAPPTLTLQIGGLTFGKVTASAASKHLALGTSTCFTTAGSSRDILKVYSLKSGESGKFATLTLEVKAQHPGKCEIKFQSESNFQAVNVNVKPEEP